MSSVKQTGETNTYIFMAENLQKRAAGGRRDDCETA